MKVVVITHKAAGAIRKKFRALPLRRRSTGVYTEIRLATTLILLFGATTGCVMYIDETDT
jgi:hypothetical protein